MIDLSFSKTETLERCLLLITMQSIDRLHTIDRSFVPKTQNSRELLFPPISQQQPTEINRYKAEMCTTHSKHAFKAKIHRIQPRQRAHPSNLHDYGFNYISVRW